MEIKTNNLESAAAGKAGERTAEKMTLNATGVEAVLRQELAGLVETEGTPTGEEIPPVEPVLEAPAGEEIVEPEGTPDPVPAEGIEPAAEPETPLEPEAPAATPLPAALETELAAWEEAGGPLPPALQAVVGKRIGKLTSARDAEKSRAEKAEAELQRVTTEAEALRNDPQRPAVTPPVNVLDEATVTRYAATAQTMMADIENYLDDTATEAERTRVEQFMQSKQLDEKGLKRELRQTQQFVNQELPKLTAAAQTFRQQEAAHAPIAQARFPWLTAKDTPEYAKAQQILGQLPELNSRLPAHQIALGTWVLGLKIMDTLNAAGHAGDALAAIQPVLAKAFPPKGNALPSTPARRVPPQPPVSGAAKPGKTVVRADEAARQQFNKVPNRATATELARQALMAG